MPPGEASKSPAAILADSAAALRAAASYRVAGMLDSGITVDIVVVRQGWSGTVSTRGVTWRGIELGGQVWFRGQALWRAILPAAEAARLGDRWTLVRDPDAAFGLARNLSHTELAIPELVFGPHAGLSARSTTLDGRRVIELRGPTDIYDVLVDAPHYPVRWLETDEPGPTGQPCGITLSRFGEAVSVAAPVDAATLDPPGAG